VLPRIGLGPVQDWQVLLDWSGTERRVRFPVTFAVERESPRVWSLRTVPVDVGQLAPALALPATDRLLLLSGGGVGAVYAKRTAVGLPLVPATLLPRLRAPVELIHVGRGAPRELDARSIPTTVLSDPEAALPPQWGSHFAMSIQDGCHGVVYAASRALLRKCLRAFLQSYQVSLLGRAADLPPISDELLDPLLEPMAPDSFVEVSFASSARFWTMDFHHLEAGSRYPAGDALRWVCEGERGSWRSGWSW